MKFSTLKQLSKWKNKKIMMKSPLKSVGMKLFLVFFVSILLFVSVVGFVSYRQSKQIIINKVATSSEQTINIAMQKIDLLFKNFENSSTQILSDVEFNKKLLAVYSQKTKDYERFEFKKELTNNLFGMVNSIQGVKSITIFPLSGNDVITTDLLKNNVDLSKQSWYQSIMKANGKVVWLKTQQGGYISDQPDPVFALGRVVKGSDDKPVGVLFFEIDSAVLTENISAIKLGDSGKLYIVDGQNNIVDALDKKQIGKKFSLPLQNKAKKNPGSQFIVDQGVQKLVVYDTSKQNGWQLIGMVQTAELVKETKSIFNFTLWMAFVAAILAGVIGLWMANMIGKPLVVLRNLMNKGAQGDLTVRVRVKSKDEIGQVGHGFNEMMEQITFLVRQTNESALEVLNNASILEQASNQTSISAKEIASATEQIASGSTNLAVDAEKGNELSLQISRQLDRMTEQNHQMGIASQEVQHSSEEGKTYMSELILKTNATEKMTLSMVEKVNGLKESTASIRNILDVLNDMTARTNILSLNATIEAARAGEAGKGFMVVAGEIRKLADQSKKSIHVVGEITENIQNEMEETVDVLEKANPLFEEQIQSVKGADVIFQSVHGQMNNFIRELQEITQSFDQLRESQNTLSEAMGNVSAVAEESAATSEEVASLSNEQLGVSEKLVNMSNQLSELSKTLKDSLMKFNT